MKKLILIFSSIVFLALVAVVPAIWHKGKECPQKIQPKTIKSTR